MADTDQKQSQKADEPTYHRDRLVAESSAFFGQPSHIVEAALSQGRLGTKVNFTRPEVDRAVKEFLDRPVELDYQQEG